MVSKMPQPIASEGGERVVKTGESWFSIARDELGYEATAPQVAAYAQEIARINGGLDVLRSNRTIRLPQTIVGENAAPTSEFMAAARGQLQDYKDGRFDPFAEDGIKRGEGTALGNRLPLGTARYTPFSQSPLKNNAAVPAATGAPRGNTMMDAAARYADAGANLPIDTSSNDRFRQGARGAQYGEFNPSQAQRPPRVSTAGAHAGDPIGPRAALAVLRDVLGRARDVLGRGDTGVRLQSPSIVQGSPVPFPQAPQAQTVPQSAGASGQVIPRMPPQSQLTNPPSGVDLIGARLTALSFAEMDAAANYGDIGAALQYRPNFITDQTRAQMGVSPYDMSAIGYIQTANGAWVNDPNAILALSEAAQAVSAPSYGINPGSYGEPYGLEPFVRRGGVGETGSAAFRPEYYNDPYAPSGSRNMGWRIGF